MIYLTNDTINMLYFATIILFFISLIVQIMLKSKMEKYAKTNLKYGKSGAEIAREMLRDHNIDDVEIKEVDGVLSEHYNPINKTLNLSSAVYHGINIGAAAVAAHECGHAIQHNRGYFFLFLRSIMVPLASFSSKFLNIFIIIGIIVIEHSLVPLEIGVILFGVTTLFSIITLPVEFNASSRALEWIEYNRIADEDEMKNARGALKLAALTYLLAAIISLIQLLRLFGILNNNRRDD